LIAFHAKRGGQIMYYHAIILLIGLMLLHKGDDCFNF